MALTNNMTRLVNKIDRRLGCYELNLPKYLQKDEWAKVIIEDSLTTFSRYFPMKIRYTVDVKKDRRGDYCLIDEDKIPGNIEILGLRDIAWEEFTENAMAVNAQPFGSFDFFNVGFDMGDLAMVQMQANHVSLFNYGIYPEWEPPNKIRLKGATNIEYLTCLPNFKIDLLIKHADNLNTIPPTKMEIFEQLAICDVAIFLYNHLKYFDGMESAFGNIDIKLGDLEKYGDKREDVVADLKDASVSAANDAQPLMYTV